MTKMLAMVLGPVLALAALVPAAAQWKPEIRFIKIGVSSAGGDGFRAGAKFSTIIPVRCSPKWRRAPSSAAAWSTSPASARARRKSASR